MVIKIFIGSLMLASSPLWAQTPTDFSHRTLEVCDLRGSGEKPVIDGSLDDRVWREHKSQDNLHQLRPKEYAEPTERTEFWVCYDRDYLYIGVMAYDADPSKIVARQHIQGFNMDSDDQINISIDPLHQKREGYFFQVNPNGMRNDALIWEGQNGFNASWDGIWFAASKILANGWSTEIKIPFKTLGFDQNVNQWGFNLGRLIRAKNEIAVWNSLGGDAWEMGPIAMGSMGDIQDVSIGRGLEVQVSGKQVYEFRAAPKETSNTSLEPSLDVFYRPLPKVTLSATLNTDFSATDVDDRIINLDRFDVYLPEKREFFLQDASRFTFGDIWDNGSPFFSRRIGLAKDGQLVDINWGLKGAGSLENTSFGVLAVNQDVPGDTKETKNLLVARASQHLTPQLSVGGVFTNGNPDIDGSAHTAGIDLSYNTVGQSSTLPFRSSFWYQETGPKQAGKDQDAWGSVIILPGTRFEFYWDIVNIGKDFDPGLGFVNRRDVRNQYSEGRYRYFFDSGILQSYAPEFVATYGTNIDNEFQSQFVQLMPLKFVSRWGDRISLGRIAQREHLDTPFNPVNELEIAAGDHEFSSNSFNFKSAESRRIFVDLDLKQGGFYSGWSRQQKVKLGFRPWDSFMFQFTYGENDVEINNKEVTTRLLGYKHEFAITNSWAWLTNIQYDNQSRRANFNYRLRWQPEPRMEMYLVYNRGSLKSEFEDRFRTERETAALKFSYLFGL